MFAIGDCHKSFFGTPSRSLGERVELAHTDFMIFMQIIQISHSYMCQILFFFVQHGLNKHCLQNGQSEYGMAYLWHIPLFSSFTILLSWNHYYYHCYNCYHYYHYYHDYHCYHYYHVLWHITIFTIITILLLRLKHKVLPCQLYFASGRWEDQLYAHRGGL